MNTKNFFDWADIMVSFYQELLTSRKELRHLLAHKNDYYEEWFTIRIEGLLEEINMFKQYLEEDHEQFQGPPLSDGTYEEEFIRCSHCNSGYYEPDLICSHCNLNLPWDTPPRKRMTELEWAEFDIKN